MEYRDSAPWQEVVVDDPEKINLFDVLPLFRLNRNDGGFYIDKSAVISRDPDDPESFEKQNVGICRLQVNGKNRIGIQPVPAHDIAAHLRKAEGRGEDLPIAIALSNDPVLNVCAAMPILYDQSEYEMAGALQVSCTPSCTLSTPVSLHFTKMPLNRYQMADHFHTAVALINARAGVALLPASVKGFVPEGVVLLPPSFSIPPLDTFALWRRGNADPSCSAGAQSAQGNQERD